jgi:hypothetical protein
MKIRDENYAVRRGGGCIEKRTLRSGAQWLDGTVRTPFGIVEVMTSPADRYSRADFVHNGRHYIRTWDGRAFSERGLVMKARQFAAAIVEEKG